MLITVKADKNIDANQELIRSIQADVSGRLDRFGTQITRVDVFLSDVNGHKSGIDKRCVMEAHVAGLQRLVSNHEASSIDEAVDAASDKLERIIDRSVERRSQRKGSVPFSGPEGSRDGGH
jgi:ribosomal subunit interface protein